MIDLGDRPWGRLAPWAVLAVALVGAVPLGALRGAATVTLWLAFAALAGAALLFWEALRTLVDPAAPADDEDDDASRLASLEARKVAALRALKDIAFERSIGRLGEEDYALLEARYRAEAKEALASLDEGVRAWRDAAEAMLDEAEREVTGAARPANPAPEPTADAERSCPKCATRSDHDAVFCKRCGERVGEEAADAQG